jgi:hypothetical protein
MVNARKEHIMFGFIRKLFTDKTPNTQTTIPANRMAFATFSKQDRAAVRIWMNGIKNVHGRDVKPIVKD